ncbi:hypothetical protein BURK2_01206 [Burkholderiales bacterium]|nr:MAG: DUF1850 domain-containing protein [Burkholderiales bacterium]CAG0969636.1 hypothetical protein BURK2_01206 [Burkholderiales bacterium]
MSVCLAAGALLATLAGNDFTLAWTHSIEKIRWEEDWRAEGGALRIFEARIRGSGAGMEPPDGAVLQAGVWHYRPQQAPQTQLLLAHTPYAAPYELCSGGSCRPLAAWLPGLPPSATVALEVCPRSKVLPEPQALGEKQ